MNVSQLKRALRNIHRRHRSIESYGWWNYLNHAQKLSVSSLYKTGYEINFIRQIMQSSIVVMSLHGKKVTVNQDGLIDTNPDIEIRR